MASSPSSPRVVGRYALCDEIAHGGMATVHVGRLVGTAGFARTVAIKRLHPPYAKDPDFVSMFVDEARLAARIHHPNVVSTLDVVAAEDELFLVMEYIQGESLARLEKLVKQRGGLIPQEMLATIFVGALHGLHAAHEARGERGEPLGIVHRDVSPQNVLVGVDGVARVLDFGVAKAAGRLQTTRDGQLKGKLAYMAPEQLRGEVARTTDVYAAGVMLWEALTGKRLFSGENEGVVITRVMQGCREPPSAHQPDVSPELDAITLRALQRDPEKRFATARDMARALEDAVPPVATSKIGDWVSTLAATTLEDRARRVESIESSSATDIPRPPPQPAGRLEPSGVRAAGPVTESVGDVLSSEDIIVTQLTTGVTAPPAAAPGPRAPRRLLVAGSAAIVLAAGLALWARSPAPGASAPSAAASSPTTPAATPMAPSPSPPPVVASASSQVAAPAPPAAPTSLPVAEGPVTPPGSAPLTPRRPPSRASPPPPPQRGGRCDPPYSIDAQGVRTFKKECL